MGLLIGLTRRIYVGIACEADLAFILETKPDFGLEVPVRNINRYLIRFAVDSSKIIIQCICYYVICSLLDFGTVDERVMLNMDQ